MKQNPDFIESLDLCDKSVLTYESCKSGFDSTMTIWQFSSKMSSKTRKWCVWHTWVYNASLTRNFSLLISILFNSSGSRKFLLNPKHEHLRHVQKFLKFPKTDLFWVLFPPLKICRSSLIMKYSPFVTLNHKRSYKTPVTKMTTSVKVSKKRPEYGRKSKASVNLLCSFFLSRFERILISR